MKHVKVEPVADEDYLNLVFKKYLDICNKAIEGHKDHFPYKEFTSAAEKLMGDSPLDMAVYDDRPMGVFSIRMKNKKLVNDNHKVDAKKAWRMNLSYLEKVVENPQEYIDHPEKLDLDWLKSRMGL